MLKYRLLLTFAWIALPVIFILRLIKGKDNVATFFARLAIGSKKKPFQNPIWLHAASVGEFNTLALLIPDLTSSFPKHNLLITVSNKIAYESALKLVDDHIQVQIAPTDFAYVVKKFLKNWTPCCLITIENEVYPNRNLICSSHNIPILYINARMSEKSYTEWAKDAQFSQNVFNCINYCFAQDDQSAKRFNKLGVATNSIEMLGNLKQFQSVDHKTTPELSQILTSIPYEKTLCAASTHKGEDQLILDAFCIAKKNYPGLKLILVPRHANRAPEIISHIKTRNLSFSQRSAGCTPNVKDDVYLADTIGEMELWYSTAAVTFVAGSLVPVGGHTPFEPAAHGSAIIHGPLYSNFQTIYQTLVEIGGSIEADTSEKIALAWIKLLDPDIRQAQLDSAHNALFQNGKKDAIMDAIMEKIKAAI